jgi:chitinase
MFTKSLAIAALAALPALGTPAVNVYWGQTGSGEGDRLRAYCEAPGFDYVTVGFINRSPSQDTTGSGYPGTNFAAHCNAAVYTYDGANTNLNSECGIISADIRYCQSKGKKVLLSIGGTFSADSDYSVKTEAEGRIFANFIWGAFGPYSASWGSKPRPFDDFYTADPGEEHFVFDGFDFDLEHAFCKFGFRCYGM